MNARESSPSVGTLTESIQRLERALTGTSSSDRPALFEARELLRVVATRLEGSPWSSLGPVCDTMQGLVQELLGGESSPGDAYLRVLGELVAFVQQTVELPGTGHAGTRRPSSGDLDSARSSFRVANETMLGEILIKQNEITRQQLDEALALQKVSRKRLGEVLLGMHAVDLEALEAAFHVQRQETLRLTEGIASPLPEGRWPGESRARPPEPEPR